MNGSRTSWWSALLALLVTGAFAVVLLGGPVSTRAVDTQRPAVPSQDERDAANALRSFQAIYRELENVQVVIGDTPNGQQALAYYEEGRIVVDPDHTISVRALLAHEIWHVIDWRDNGRIDWGEQIPPAEESDYLR